MKPTATLDERSTLADRLDKIGSIPSSGEVVAITDRVGRESTSETDQEGGDDLIDSQPTPDDGEEASASTEPDVDVVPEHVRRFFDRCESEEFAPFDFKTQVAVDSVESQVGYTSLYRQLQADYLSEVAYLRSEEGGALGLEEARAEAFRKCSDPEKAIKRLNKLFSLP